MLHVLNSIYQTNLYSHCFEQLQNFWWTVCMAAMQPESIKLAFGPHTGPQTSTHPSRMQQASPNPLRNDSEQWLIHTSTIKEIWREIHCQTCCFLLCAVYVTTFKPSDFSCTKNPLIRNILCVSMVQFSSKKKKLN